MEKARIEVFIPTLNNVDEIDKTIESVWNQNYDNDSIWITAVDFESEDGTYEKLLSYDRYHFGVYQLENPHNRRLMVAYAARKAAIGRPGGAYSFMVLLYPGEILYPDCLRKCADAYIKYQYRRPSMVICEADIIDENGVIRKQKPLYGEERIMDGYTEMKEYVTKGYQHQIFMMKGGFATGKYKGYGEMNESRFWNKAARANNEAYPIYLPEALACTKEINYYEDELEEILYRWEAIASVIKSYESLYEQSFHEGYEYTAMMNVAEYALWRSYKLYSRGGKRKDIEDCFLISSVVMPDIESSQIHQWMEQLVMGGDTRILSAIQEYFAAEG